MNAWLPSLSWVEVADPCVAENGIPDWLILLRPASGNFTTSYCQICEVPLRGEPNICESRHMG